MLLTTILGASLLTTALAHPQSQPSRRQTNRNCPSIHVFGARETTAPPGFGSAGSLINQILASNPGATAEAIVYPACGGQDFCGSIEYADSARQGTAAVVNAVNSFNLRCPRTRIVLVGYSQGGQITDNAFCGGGDTNIGLAANAPGTTISARAAARVSAVILLGSPRFVANTQPYNVGDCTAQGFAPRAPGFSCGAGAAKIQSYCDDRDPFCCKGTDLAVHAGYGTQFGQEAAAFVQRKLRGF